MFLLFYSFFQFAKCTVTFLDLNKRIHIDILHFATCMYCSLFRNNKLSIVMNKKVNFLILFLPQFVAIGFAKVSDLKPTKQTCIHCA